MYHSEHLQLHYAQRRVKSGVFRQHNAEHMAAGSVKDGAWQAHDAILEMLNLHGAGQQKLGSGDMGPGNASAPGAATGTGQGSPGAGVGAGEDACCLMKGHHVMHLLNSPASQAFCQAQPMQGLAWGWVWVRSGVNPVRTSFFCCV